MKKFKLKLLVLILAVSILASLSYFVFADFAQCWPTNWGRCTQSKADRMCELSCKPSECMGAFYWGGECKGNSVCKNYYDIYCTNGSYYMWTCEEISPNCPK